MSVFVCSENHLSTIVAWADRYGVIRPAPTQPAVVNLLHEENVKSYNARYKEDNPVIPVENKIPKSWPSPIQVIKLCQCLAYQSCEHDGWGTSRAKVYLDQVIQKAISKIPGYDEARWDV